jgi:glycine/D-amino acid oxidase-like deaminating enzyme
VRYHIDGGLHPAKYHDGLLRVVRDAGAVFAPHTEITDLQRNENGFRVATTRGNVDAGQVAICTNGYTGNASNRTIEP